MAAFAFKLRSGSASLSGGEIMSTLLISCVLAVAQTGGSGPSITGFWYGAGRVVGILVAVLVGGVLVALVRAGGCRK